MVADATGGRVEILLTSDALYCANEGAPIDADGVDAIMSSHISMKRGAEIGRFGLGFKSVLGVTTRPEIYSQSGSFCCDPAEAQRLIRAVAPRSEKMPRLRIARPIDPIQAQQEDLCLRELMSWATTVVKLTLDSGGASWLSEDLASFPREFLLFCPHVSVLVFEDRTKGLRREITLQQREETVALEEGEDVGIWKVFKTVHIPSAAARMDAGELADRESLPLMWAVPLQGRQLRGVFWAFFPTEYFTTLSGILNAPWKTNEDRQNLLTGPFNRELIEAGAKLIAESLPKIIDAEDPGKFLDLLPARGREAPNWADGELTEGVYEQVSSHPCIPDQEGVLGFASKVKLHPSDVPQDALEIWAMCPDRPTNWCHPTVENPQRRSRVERLLASANQAAQPFAIWLEALVNKPTPVASIAALKAAAKTVEALPKSRQEVETARIVLTTDGLMVAPRPAAVFLPPEELDRAANLTLVHREVVADSDAKVALSILGIGPVDASSELQTLLATVDLSAMSDVDWDRFWKLARRVPAEDALRIIRRVAGDDARGVVKVRTRNGKFRLLKQTLLPGFIVAEDDARNAVCIIDLSYHESAGLLSDRDAEGLLLKALGAVNAPVPDGGSTHELWFTSYRDRAVAELHDTLRARQARPQENLLQFDRRKTIGPLEPLFFLDDPGRARFTEAALPAIVEEPNWTLAHQTRRDSYPIIECEPPSLFVILKHGRLRTSGGIFPIDTCVGPSLSEFSLFLPVVDCTHEAARRLRLPFNLADLLQKHWDYADAAAEKVNEERTLTDFYASASEYRPAPRRIRCRIGESWDHRPPQEVTVACNQVERHALQSIGIPLIEATPNDAQTLFARWQMQPSAKHVTVEVRALPSGPETPLLDQFPGLQTLLPVGCDQLRLVPCSGLRLEVRTASGRSGEDHDLLRREDQIFFLDHLSSADLLRSLVEHFCIDLDQSAQQEIFDYRKLIEKRERTANVREQTTLQGKLLAAVGVEAIVRRLPKGLQDVVQDSSGSLGAERLAELVLAVYGVDTLHVFREELEANGLNPPSAWAGSHSARVFARSLGFPPEFAGFEQRRRDPTLEVLGPPQLNALHSFQEMIVREIELMNDRTQRRRGLLSLPTGAGKTRIAVEALTRIIRRDGLVGPILWVAQSDELCEQAVQTWSYVWRAFGPSMPLLINRLWATNEADAATEATQVVVATIQKIQGCVDDPNYDWLAKASWLVVDEAHGAIEKSYTALLTWQGLRRKEDRCPLIGLTATPFRGGEDETERLVRRFGGLRLDQGALGSDPYADLQQMGVLARVDHEVLTGATLELSDKELAELQRLRLLPAAAGDRLGANVSRNEMLLDSIRRMPADWPVLLFAVSVDHSQTMAALLSLQGIPAAAISAQTEPGARKHYIEEFRKDHIRVLTNFAVLTAGFDAPSVRAIIVARPTYSPVLYQQMIGRGLRGPLNGGKERCLIVNVQDNIARFGEELAFRQFEYLWRPRGNDEEV